MPEQAQSHSRTILTKDDEIGRFRVISLLGQGGMGTVYRAEDMQLRRQVALKILLEDGENDAIRRERFVREARLAAALHHPAIATIFEVGEDAERPYLAIELIEGQTLRDLLLPGPMNIKTALNIAVQVAQGMAHAQAHGVLHRDLKPENIMVTADGQAKILDFGLAKSLQSTAESKAFNVEQATLEQSLSREGFIVGTPGYMSPEQVRGRDLDQRSDVFTFAIILHEMLTGASCFGGNTPMDLLIAISRDPPVQARELNQEVSQDLQNILNACLEKDLDKRCAEFSVLADKLSVILNKLRDDDDGDDLHQRATLLDTPHVSRTQVDNKNISTKIIPRGRRRQRAMSLAAVMLFMLIALALLWSQRGRFANDHDSAPSHRGPSLRIATFGLSAPLSIYPRYVNGIHLYASLNVSEFFMKTNPAGLLPAAVERWESSPDRRYVDLYLRPGMHFHDHPCFSEGKGRVADIQDLRYSLELPVKMAYSLPPIMGVEDFAQGKTEHIKGLQVQKDHLRVDFGRPCAFCLNMIANAALVPQELESYLKTHKLDRLVGTGPFQMRSPEVAGHLDLVAFDNWGQASLERNVKKSQVLPRSKGLSLMQIRDPEVAIRSMLQGQLDAYYLDSSTSNNAIERDIQGKIILKEELQRAGLRLSHSVSEASLFIVFVSIPPKKNSPLQNPQLRHIISLALDRKALCAGLPLQPSGSLLQDDQLGYLGRDQEQGGEAEQAKKLYQEYLAQHKTPRPLIIGGNKKLWPLIVKQLKQLDIPVEISRANINSKQAKDMDLLVYSWAGPLVGNDPSMLLYHMLGQVRPTFLDEKNRVHFQEMMYELDQDKRRELIENLQKTLLKQERMLFVAHLEAQTNTEIWIFRDGLQGLIDSVTGESLFPENFALLYKENEARPLATK